MSRTIRVEVIANPERIQLRRTRGWRKPKLAVVVSRPTMWGNPWSVHTIGHEITVHGPGGFFWPADSDRRMAQRFVVSLYRKWLEQGRDAPALAGPVRIDERRERAELEHRRQRILTKLPTLRDRDLCCWCGLDEACHGDVLLELANRGDH